MKRKIKLYLLPGVLVLLVAIWYFGFNPGKSSSGEILTAQVRRGDLLITVLENGNLRAKNNLELRSEVTEDNGVKILSIVPEGYRVTEEDVIQGKVLVELDPSTLKDALIERESDLQQSSANLTEASENRSIQQSQNESALKTARQAARFAQLDLMKFMGRVTAEKILQAAGLPHNDSTFYAYEAKLMEESQNHTEQWDDLPPPPSLERSAIDAPLSLEDPQALGELDVTHAVKPTAIPEAAGPAVAADAPVGTQANHPPASNKPPDFISYIEKEGSIEDGDAVQQLRKLQDELLVAQNELAVASQNFEGSQRLFDKGFITKSNLEKEQLSLDKTRLAVKSAETALALYRDYELPKQAEKFFSDYEEALRGLERSIKENRAKMAQVEAKWLTARQSHQINLEKKKQLEYEIASCRIVSTLPGLVAYGSSRRKSYGDDSDPILEGARVRYRQTLITIPDMTSMAVDVSIPESRIKAIEAGMTANIEIDAVPDKRLQGTVTEVAVLPDSSNMRYSSSKVYPITLDIQGVHDWLKPGMSAKTEILSKKLTDVIYVPLQAVNRDGDDYVCFLPEMAGWEKRKVTVGEANDKFIQITNGLEVDEAVALSIPSGQELRSAERTPEFNNSQGKPAPANKDAQPGKEESRPGGKGPRTADPTRAEKGTPKGNPAAPVSDAKPVAAKD